MTAAELQALPVGTRIRTTDIVIPCRVENYKQYTSPFPYFPANTVFEIVKGFDTHLRQVCVQLVIDNKPLTAHGTTYGYTTYDVDIRAHYFELEHTTTEYIQIVY